MKESTRMKTKHGEFSTTTAQIVYLYQRGYSTSEIIPIISEDWSMSIFNATSCVEYSLKQIKEV